MAQYTVKRNQNLFDISIELYGSIEGIFDLLISNPTLSMITQLKEGDVLECHPSDFILNDGIVQQIQQQGLSVQNGSRHVYYKDIQERLRVVLNISSTMNYLHFNMSGDGTVYIDWGDNSDVEKIMLTSDEVKITHYFNNTILEDRQVKMYGEFNVQTWTQIDKEIEIQPVTPIVVY